MVNVAVGCFAIRCIISESALSVAVRRGVLFAPCMRKLYHEFRSRNRKIARKWYNER